MIYLDHAATTPPDAAVVQAMADCMAAAWHNPGAAYAASEAPRRILRQARQAVAGMLNARPQEVLFTAGGTEGNNQALTLAKGGHVIVGAVEHASVLKAARRHAARGDGDPAGRRRANPARGRRAGPAPGHPADLRAVRQQRNRRAPAGGRDRRAGPFPAGALPVRRGAGLRQGAHRRAGAEHRPADPVRPQVLRTPGRGLRCTCGRACRWPR